jgi:hypothetical protein
MFLLACGHEEKGPNTDADGIRRDAIGCWADPEQIWSVSSDRYCTSDSWRRA